MSDSHLHSSIRSQPSYRVRQQLLALLLLAVPCVGPVFAQTQINTEITIANRSTESIHFLYVSPSGHDRWGDDLLGSRTLQTGASIKVNPGALNGCMYDIRVIYRNQQSEERRNLNLCTMYEVPFTGGATPPAEPPRTNDTRVELVNESSRTIQYLFVSPSSVRAWGDDRLGQAVLQPGGRFRLDPGSEAGCTYDVRVVFADRQFEERRNINLCATSTVTFDGSTAAPTGTEARSSTGRAFGTAFYVTSQGLALTNHHVVNGCRSIAALTDRGPVQAHVVRQDERNDLALLRVTASEPVPHAAFRASSSVRPGDGILVVGFPLQDVLQNGLNVTVGNVSALAGLGGNTAVLQITAPVQPGNSGGPVLDMSGNVVGVVMSKLDTSAAQNVNFAVHGSVARLFVEAEGHRAGERASSTLLPVNEIVDAVRGFTFQVDCQR